MDFIFQVDDFVYLIADSSIFNRTLQVEIHNSVEKLFIGLKQEHFGIWPRSKFGSSSESL
jgi:hypothetical protein